MNIYCLDIKKRKITIFLVLLLLSACLKPSNNEFYPFSSTLLCQVPSSSFKSFYGNLLINAVNNDSFTNRLWQGVPSIGIDKNGTLYAAWYSGGAGEQIGNYVTLSVSTDTGKTWMNNMLFVAPTDSDRFFDATFINDFYGNLYLSVCRQMATKSYKDYGSLWVSSLTFNKQKNLISASQPYKLADGHMMNKPTIVKTSNSVLFPISVWFQNDSITQAPFVYKANLDIQCLTNFQKNGFIPLSDSLRNGDEHMIVQISDSNYLAFIRSIDGIYFSKSIDAANWTPSVKFTTLGATTNSRFHLRKLKSGRLLLIMNNSLGRTNLKLFLSDDNGLTWPYSLLIDSRSQVSYPDMVEIGNGDLYIVYDYNRYTNGEIDFVHVNENDIVNGMVSNLNKVVIDKLK